MTTDVQAFNYVLAVSRHRSQMGILACLLAVVLPVEADIDTTKIISIDVAYPGGNVVVDRVMKDKVFLRPDLRDTEGWWFYWNYRVAGVSPGRTVTFTLGEPNPIGVRGPAVSTDSGKTWFWLGLERCDGSSFAYTFPGQAEFVWFSFSVPYQESDLRTFLKTREKSRFLSVESLCKSAGGRNVELVRAGYLVDSPHYRVLLTARHHACETMASFVLEGILDTVLRDDEIGRWFQNHVEVWAVPFMDKDGVEEGDQGKNRRPRDHNRDYIGKSIYPETSALRNLVERWPQGHLGAAIDFHCPYIRGTRNEHIYLVGSPNKAMWENQQAFGVLLESANDSPLPYRPSDNLPFGESWNTSDNYEKGRSFARWAETIGEVRLSTTIEFPYANVGGEPVTADRARHFGRVTARALRKFLQGS